MRLDVFLVEKNIIKSRERAKEHIKNGDITVNGHVVFKPAFEISEADDVKFTGTVLKYVGRGGLKLEKALKCFNIDLNGKVCLDIGASTGGFTDCMLQNGASHVYAVDVGHGQLDSTLVADNRVTNMEKTNINDVFVESFELMPEFISADVSFVSLKNVLPKISEFMSNEGSAVVLIKPQFEAGKSNIGKNGIVKDRKVHISVLNDIISYCNVVGLYVNKIDYSPISGGDGNIEYLAFITANKNLVFVNNVKDIVNTAFSEVKK